MKKLIEIFKFTTKYFKKNKLKLSIFLLISLFVWGISIILPLVNGRIIDMLVLKEFNENLIKMILIILFLNNISIKIKYIVKLYMI